MPCTQGICNCVTYFLTKILFHHFGPVSFNIDGFSNRGNLNTDAPALRNAGVQVYTVGIGNINIDQLRLIASDPDNEHVFILRNFLDAAGFVDFLSVTTCDGRQEYYL